MRCRALRSRTIGLLAVLAVAACLPSLAQAQTAGVSVDAQGVLQTHTYADPGGRLMQARIAAAKASLEQELIPYSKMRFVCLNRLEAEIQSRHGVPTGWYSQRS